MSVEHFSYLLTEAGENSVEATYPTREDLGSKFLTRKECDGYYLFPGVREFLTMVDQEPAESRVYHEVILDGPQKLKFDVDAKLPDLLRLAGVGATPEDACKYYRGVFTQICRAIQEQFYICWGVIDVPLLVCVSAPPEGCPVEKYSNHIIVPGYYVSGARQAREFTSRVLNILEPGISVLLDVGVNSNIQNFRCVGCHKKDSLRVKRVIGDWPKECTIICNIDSCQPLTDISTVEILDKYEAFDNNLSEIPKYLDACKAAGILDSFKYRSAHRGFIYFDRIRPCYCKICERQHTTDNNLYVQVSIFPGNTVLRVGCRDYDNQPGHKSKPFSQRSWVIGSIANNVPTEGGPTMRRIDRNLARVLAEEVSEDVSFPQTHTYCENAEWNIYTSEIMKPFEVAETLVVQAAMKMGKTKMLKDFVSTYYPGLTDEGKPTKLHDASVCIISFRQTFTGMVSAAFPDFTIYNEAMGPLTQRRIIVQFESLHRLAMPIGAQPFDLLVCDESESIIGQMSSNLSKQFGECLKVFKWLAGYSRQVICMDAHITSRTLTTLQQMRPENNSKARLTGDIRGLAPGVTIHWNKHQNATSDKWYYHTEIGTWAYGLRKYLGDGKRVVIPISSLTEARGIVNGLKSEFPKLRVYMYSSETSPSEKRSHFADVNKFWKNYDVLVYTPTVSAGVSFEQIHYDVVFGYFSDMSCPAETCIQMVGRIRNVGMKEYHIFVTALGANLPETIEDVRASVLQSRQAYTQGDNLADYNGLEMEYDVNGRGVILYESSYFHVWAENMIARNRTKNDICAALVRVVRKSGAVQMAINSETFEELFGVPMYTDEAFSACVSAALAAHKSSRTEAMTEKAIEIADAKDIDELAAARLQECVLAQTDISAVEMREYDRYKLRMAYNYRGEISSKFVLTYDVAKKRRAYKNLCRLEGFASSALALDSIKQLETAAYQRTASYGLDMEYVDLHRRYVYMLHQYAHTILAIIGWAHLRDRTQLHAMQICSGVSDRSEEFWRCVKEASMALDIYAPRQVYIDPVEKMAAKIMSITNRIIGEMYACKIRKVRGGACSYEIIWPHDLFALTAEESDQRGVPHVAAVLVG